MAPQQTLQQLANAAPTLRLMNEDFRLQCLATGCAPTCHFCDKPIELDEPFGFRRIQLPGFKVSALVFAPGMSAMGCAACVEGATPEQVAHALELAQVRLPDIAGDVRASLVVGSTEKPVREGHRGCFVTNDGRVF